MGKNHSDKSRQSQEPKPIRFTIALHEKQEESSPTIDWRSELKRKLNHHIQKKESSKPELEQRSNPGTSRLGLEPRPLGQHGRTEEVRETQSKQPLFQYILPERSSRDPKKNATFHQKVPTPSVPERPVIRRPAKVRPILQPSQQGTLALEEPRPSPITNSPDASSVKTIEQAELSGEILFSRLLAGIIDLVLVVAEGVFFALSASWILNFDFFSVNSLHLTVVFSLFFFFLSSFFFLVTRQQTPGMYVSDLRLVGGRSEQVSSSAVLIRIVLFLPVVFTLVGLFVGLFDPWKRCIHDHLSKTRVVPNSGRSPSRGADCTSLV